VQLKINYTDPAECQH